MESGDDGENWEGTVKSIKKHVTTQILDLRTRLYAKFAGKVQEEILSVTTKVEAIDTKIEAVNDKIDSVKEELKEEITRIAAVQEENNSNITNLLNQILANGQ
jgi:uncharacterized protein YaaN involved in tellurite resistance